MKCTCKASLTTLTHSFRVGLYKQCLHKLIEPDDAKKEAKKLIYSSSLKKKKELKAEMISPSFFLRLYSSGSFHLFMF